MYAFFNEKRSHRQRWRSTVDRTFRRLLQEQYPPNGFARVAGHELVARADRYRSAPNSTLQYRFEVCEANQTG